MKHNLRDDIFGGEFSPQTESAISRGSIAQKESSQKRMSDGLEEFIDIKVNEIFYTLGK